MSQPSLTPHGEGRYVLAGELSWQTVPALLRRAELRFEPQAELVIDLAQVERSDSAGLALLTEWLRQARRRGARLRFVGLPEQMRSLARVSGVLDILPLAEA